MRNVSRPLIGLLVATVAFFALWIVALKPSSSSNGQSSQGLGQYQRAINAAHSAVKLASGAATAQGGNLASPQSSTTPAATTATAAPAATTKATATTAATTTAPTTASASAPARPATSAAHSSPNRLTAVERALAQHRVIALLFYNPAGADDRAVKHELATVPAHKGRVVKFAVPLSELSNYLVVTNQVSVTSSPTLVLINRAAQATTIVGFADGFEIGQRVNDALVK